MRIKLRLTCLAVLAYLALAATAAGTPSRTAAVSIRKAVIGSFQIMLISDKETRECYGCSDSARRQANWGLLAMRRFTQLLKPGRTRRQADALSAAFQANRWWGLAGFQLADNSDVYDLYVHRAIRYAWRAAGLLTFRDPSGAATRGRLSGLVRGGDLSSLRAGHGLLVLGAKESGAPKRARVQDALSDRPATVLSRRDRSGKFAPEMTPAERELHEWLKRVERAERDCSLVTCPSRR